MLKIKFRNFYTAQLKRNWTFDRIRESLSFTLYRDDWRGMGMEARYWVSKAVLKIWTSNWESQKWKRKVKREEWWEEKSIRWELNWNRVDNLLWMVVCDGSFSQYKFECIHSLNSRTFPFISTVVTSRYQRAWTKIEFCFPFFFSCLFLSIMKRLYLDKNVHWSKNGGRGLISKECLCIG